MLRFTIGLLMGLGGMLLLGEAFVRLAPPPDLQAYLPETSQAAGPFVADPALGIAYKSFQSFVDDNRARVAELDQTRGDKPVWMLFGNSFVQAPGMLGDTAMAALPDKHIYYLRRNELLQVRVAQLRELAKSGMRPENVLFIVLPVDLLGLAENPPSLSTATPAGGFARRLPLKALGYGPFDHSRLVLIAKIRAGWGKLVPGFRARQVMEPLAPEIAQELGHVFEEIGALAKMWPLKVTIVYIPNREQIMGDAARSPQAAFEAAARNAGLRFLDTSAVFLAEQQRAGLLIPDGHLSARGNKLLLSAILEDWQAASDPSGVHP